MSAILASANNSNIPSSDGENMFSQAIDFLLKYVYENPLKIFEDNSFAKRYSLIVIHAVFIALLFTIIPDKMMFLSYVSAFWLVFLILMIWLTDNLYDVNPIG